MFVRYWLSAGRGDFAVSPRQRHGSCQFYVMVGPPFLTSHFSLLALAAAVGTIDPIEGLGATFDGYCHFVKFYTLLHFVSLKRDVDSTRSPGPRTESPNLHPNPNAP